MTSMNREPEWPEVDLTKWALELNDSAGTADTNPMGTMTEQEQAEAATGEQNSNPGHRPGTSADEIERLREKASILAMQKRYWWQRYTEVADQCRLAEVEILRLREALAHANAAAGSMPEPPVYVDSRLLS
jgi:hypothetical protein